VLDYGLYTYGYHFGEQVMHAIIDERHNDYAEMFLHHLATSSLYFGYIMANYLGIGTIIAFLHDTADIPAHLVKFQDATGQKTASKVTFAIVMLIWFWTRCLCLPAIIYTIFSEFRYPADRSHFDIYIYLNGIFLSVLAFLHCYWFTLFIKILTHLKKTGEGKDLQNDVEVKKKDQ
jgi:sphingoid base N-palmitoyltransferase